MRSSDPTLRIDLAEKAADLWLVDRRFSLAELADRQGIALRDLLLEFDTRRDLLTFYFDSRWTLFRTLKGQVPDYGTYTAQERLSNLLYSLLDLMSPQKTFVVQAFGRYGNTEAFRKAFREEMREAFDSPELSASARVVLIGPFYEAVWLAFLGLLDYWGRDRSKNGEDTAALIDKSVALLAELLTNAVADKALDLGRFLLRDARKAWKSTSWRRPCGCSMAESCRCGRCGRRGGGSKGSGGTEKNDMKPNEGDSIQVDGPSVGDAGQADPQREETP